MKEYKLFDSDIQDLDSKKGIVIISVAGIGNKDSVNDIILPNAFKKTITENLKKIYHLVDHEWSTQKMIGVPIKMYETQTQLIAESQLNLKSDLAKDIFAQYLQLKDLGRSFEHSIGFSIPKDKSRYEDDTRLISEVKLYEYSTVLLGANSNTETIAIKDLEQKFNYPYAYKTLKRIESMLSLFLKQEADLLPDSKADNTVLPEHEDNSNIEIVKVEQPLKTITLQDTFYNELLKSLKS